MGIEEEPYLYGTHYSVSGHIIGYLIRMEPYTTLHLELQNHRFDKSDRLFIGMDMAYSSVTSRKEDIRELIPEFFYLPEFLKNKNCYDFGKRSNYTKIE